MAKSTENIELPTTATIRDVMEVLSQKTTTQIVFIVDNKRKVLGCITDGDMRRALLRGETLACSVGQVMRESFLSVGKQASKTAIFELMKKNGVRQIPILDSLGRLRDLKLMDEFLNEPRVFDSPVVIMAGGKGSRLAPFTDDTPKPLLHIGGRPIIEHIISDLQAKGAQDFHITVNYLAEKIMNELGDGSRLNCNIRYVQEPKPLGTAGSLALVRDKIDRNFLVVNGDILSTVDVGMLVEFHEQNSAIATVCAKEFRVNIPYGVVRTKDNGLLGIDEKPSISFVVNAGIYYFSPEVLQLVSEGEHLDMPGLLSRLLEAGKPVKCFKSQEPWIDIGSKTELDKAQQGLVYLTK